MVTQLLQNAMVRKDVNQELKEFVSSDPKARYTFDSERDSTESELCRQGKGYEECVTLKMTSKRMFEAMQKYGYFCALPSDPTKTHMECKPLL